MDARLAAVVLVVLVGCVSGQGIQARAQLPVIDEGMLQHNLMQTSQQILERTHEIEKAAFYLRLLVTSGAYEGRDLSSLAPSLAAVMEGEDVRGYTTDDLATLIEETFPGYENRANWAEHHQRRLESLARSYQAVLLSLQWQHTSRETEVNALEKLRLEITRSITPGHPNGEGSTQTMMEIRAAARLTSQEETVLIRQALLNRALMRNLELSNAAHTRGNAAATLERMLGVKE